MEFLKKMEFVTNNNFLLIYAIFGILELFWTQFEKNVIRKSLLDDKAVVVCFITGREQAHIAKQCTIVVSHASEGSYLWLQYVALTHELCKHKMKS